MKVLLVEDEVRVASFIKKGLEEQGHLVTQAFDGGSGYKLATQNDYDIVILDVIMPVMTGLQVCEKLRSTEHFSTPILMLTALGSTDDIVLGLETGADDYLSKPFKFKELLARINVLFRRGESKAGKTGSILTVKDLKMDRQSKEVWRADTLIELTSKEFHLLEYFLVNKNIVVSRVGILESVWGVDFDLGTNVIDVYVSHLRRKIQPAGSEKIITTVIGMGYIIKD